MKLPKTYEPKEYEADIYALWEKSRAFEPSDATDSYSIVVPPPNANGNLHLGHGLTLAIEDTAVRYNRLRGKSTLLVPGADHAGFETQVVYERQLAKEGKSRFDFSREDLYKNIWAFVAENKENYESQFRRLGASVDWSRYTFTLDEKVVHRAHQTFKKMWDEGLIYRGERLVNYCTFHQTGFADIEVAYEDQTTPLYYLKYGPFTLATTRPETKFGDTAVAVHPDDKRYKKWVNKVITVDGLNGPFELRVVADEMVDPEFGTGAVKITPAHDFNDWEVAERHNLPAVRVINHDGTMNHVAGEFAGMPVKEARQAVVAALKEKGLLDKVDEQYQNRVGHCYKCGTVIEPMLLDQWFIQMKPLVEPAIAALEAGKITFHPESKKTQLIRYYQNLKDWNISRQIAWGIPIPAFQNINDSDDWIFGTRTDQELLEIDGKTYRRDPDVFDTWFSSASWPYATLDYPDSDDFKKFYPLSLMETGADILYPWVSRMLMFGLYNIGEVPFKAVYLHGLINDEHGQKMSKSKGNVINPMEVIDEYGTDAFRLGIMLGESAGNNRAFDTSKIVGARNFCNKLWNIARFVEASNDGEKTAQAASLTDHWILHKLQQCSDDIAAALDAYRFSDGAETLYHFVWDDLADWYIEASKATPNPALLRYVLEQTLKIAHPFAPFVTETIWQTLHAKDDTLLITSTWPSKIIAHDPEQAQTFTDIQAIVSEARRMIQALGAKHVTLTYTDAPLLAENATLITRLARLAAVEATEQGSGLKLTETRFDAWLAIDKSTAAKYIHELETKLAAQKQAIKQFEARLANKAYVKNAPVALVEQTKLQLQEAKATAASITTEIARFGQNT